LTIFQKLTSCSGFEQTFHRNEEPSKAANYFFVSTLFFMQECKRFWNRSPRHAAICVLVPRKLVFFRVLSLETNSPPARVICSHHNRSACTMPNEPMR